jgi:hypothetical protein
MVSGKLIASPDLKRCESMTLHGHIQNGIIVLDGNISLPEGAAVEVQIVLPQGKDSQIGKQESMNELPTLAESLKDFIGILEDLPEDAATNHDHYLYGAPKKS